MQRFMRFLLPSLFLFLIYFWALPWLALQLDKKYFLLWKIPFWTETVAAVFLFISIAIMFRFFR